MNKKLIDYLLTFITPERKSKIESVLAERTNYFTIVLEDIYQPHNSSAVLRSCDCFGIQSLHVIENLHHFSYSKKVERGSSKWVDVFKYNGKGNNSKRAIENLKSRGYKIVVTSPHPKGKMLEDLDVEAGKIALVFGTEKHGVSEEVIKLADDYVQIPMYGFTESFNISVSAALCMQYLTSKIRALNVDFRLSELEYDNLKLDWIRKSLPHPEILENKFLSNNN